MPRIDVQKFLKVSHAGLIAEVNITNCRWCTDVAICSHHGEMANRIRKSLAKTAAKRSATA